MNSPEQRPKVGIGVLVLRGGKVLLGKRKNAHGEGRYALPGGHMEWGESFEDTVRREVGEETGLEVENIRPVAVLNTVFGEEKHYIDVDFAADAPAGEPECREPEKCEGWGWYDPENLPSPMFITSENIIRHYLEARIFDDPSTVHRQ